MSDEKKPPLSPQEQQQNEDAAKIQTEFGVTDAAERAVAAVDKMGFGFGNSGGLFARTSFEERALNDMLDLLDGANPSDLENAGKNLERAKKSLNDAAQELSDFVRATDWQGEGATEFQRYGGELAGYAWGLASFANVVGTQMSVAATGLTSVRNSKPPRDNRADPRRPRDFPVSEQREDNPEYKRAVQAEENRQEAINQMNRLASFYAVSEQSLAGVKEPELPKMLAADVPQPTLGQRVSEPGPAASGRASLDDIGGHSADGSAGGAEGPARRATGGLTTPLPSTSMEIDSVKTLPPTTTNPGPTQPPTAPVGPSSGNQHFPSPLGPNLGPPVRGGGPRSGPPLAPRGGGPGPVSNAKTSTGGSGRQGPVGRPTPMGGGTNSSSQANRGPVGRPTAMGPGVGRGGGTGATRSPMVGRPSTGGPPMGGRSGPGSSSAPRTSRANGIVGGTPQRASGGGTSASGSRIPRGNVIGGPGNTTPGRPSSAARPSQSGVVGAGPAKGGVRPTGRNMPSSNNGVVGTPRSGGTPPGSGAGGFTTGGAGLSGDRRGEPERPVQPGTEPRVDDAETRAARRRDAVPPVIE
ncbi:hypothetical protein [Streptomyces sp. IB2014 016-6]|uniref:hypothetical protein n=1 Tax=Streptomyces sp. IB2014 016-6 TaxID=2517818 RepID=UPI0011C7A311|nr:hypothetical protein [Streptomyces sp. IB2014 016-6]TXL84102.1 hypothetical protein EW053_35385 [Streptomyces sp. IB2014 016-6]